MLGRREDVERSGFFVTDGFGSDAPFRRDFASGFAFEGGLDRFGVARGRHLSDHLVERVAERSGVGRRCGRGLDRRRSERLEHPIKTAAFSDRVEGVEENGLIVGFLIEEFADAVHAELLQESIESSSHRLLKRGEFNPVLRASRRSRKSRAGGSCFDADTRDVDDEEVRPNSF